MQIERIKKNSVKRYYLINDDEQIKKTLLIGKIGDVVKNI